MKTLSFIAAGAVLAVAGFAATPQTAEAQQRGAPRGSYVDSCSGAYVNQGRLYADCRDTRGRTRSTSIELAPCSSSDIGNDNGLLVCHNVRGQFENNGGGNNGGNNGGGWGGGNNGGNNGGGWGGGNNGGNNGGGWGGGNNGRNGVIVYSDSNYRGQSEAFRSEVPNLGRSGLNDQISSIEINGGPWEFCTDAYFRGECQVIYSSTRNLNNTNINDRISSMRPARRGGGW